MCRKNQSMKPAPIARKTTRGALLLPACRIPKTTNDIPSADRTAPTLSNGRLGSAATGSTIRRLSRMIVPTTAACSRNESRQLTAVVISPPINGPAAAPMPPMPLIRPKARARERKSVKAIVARM